MKDKKNILNGPFSRTGLKDVIIGICNQYNDLIDKPSNENRLHGDAVSHYKDYMTYSNTSEFVPIVPNITQMYFPVGKNHSIKIDIRLQGAKPRYYKPEGKTYTYKVTLHYNRDDFKPTRYKRAYSKEMWSTKNSFNLNLVFKAIEEAKQYITKKVEKNLGIEAIQEIEKIAWDGMFNADGKRENHWSTLKIETQKENVHHYRYNTNEPTGIGADAFSSSIEEHIDKEGKKFFNLKNIKITLEAERSWSNKSFYRFDNPEELKKVLDEARTAIAKLSSMLKETVYVGETEASRITS